MALFNQRQEELLRKQGHLSYRDLSVTNCPTPKLVRIYGLGVARLRNGEHTDRLFEVVALIRRELKYRNAL